MAASAVNEDGGAPPGVRDQLVAELQRTVDTVTAAVDAAAARTIEAAEAEARRRTAEVVELLDGAGDGGLARMQALAGELAQRAAELERDLAELAELAARTRAELVAESRAAASQREAPTEERAEDGDRDAPIDPLDRVELAQEQLRAASRQPLRRRFRRSRTDDVPDGVRVIVHQMRLDGRSDAEIAARLEEMGIEDAADLLARVSD